MIPTMHESRLAAMADPDCYEGWDLNNEDRAAIQWALDTIAGKRAREPEAATLLNACRAVLLFHRGGEWTAEDRTLWHAITECEEATTKVLCDTVRAAVARAEKATKEVTS